MALIIDPISDNLFCDSIRRLLGGVDEDVLPDEDIVDSAILDMAEIKVIDLIPTLDLTLLTASEKMKLRLATIYYMAYLLCPSMPSRVDIEVKTIDLSWKRKAVDYEELAEKLLNQVMDLLDDIAGFDLGGDSKIFAIAPSRRGKHAER